MIPPIYSMLAASSAVTAIVADRIGACGQALPDESRPYITWAIITGAPDNTLDAGPQPSDRYTVQIDAWHTSEPGLRALAAAARAAVELECVVTALGPSDRDDVTGMLHYQIQLDYIAT